MFLKPLKKTSQLKLFLYSIQDFSAIEGMENIKRIELYQLRKLVDVSFLNTLRGLEYISL